MYHVPVTFLLRSRGVSVTYLYLYGLSLSYVRLMKAYVLRSLYVRVTYVWRMKCTRMYYVPFLSAAYLFTLFMQFAHYSYQLSEVEDATGEI